MKYWDLVQFDPIETVIQLRTRRDVKFVVAERLLCTRGKDKSKVRIVLE
jgi:hypothetical protein